MATKTTTTYTCDGCQKETKKASDFRRFTLSESKITPKETIAEAKTDLCTACESALHVEALPFFPPSEREKLEGIVR